MALPIFPASHPASIVGANELNFCVRDGNRWTLAAINTNFFVAHRHFMSKASASNLYSWGIVLKSILSGHHTSVRTGSQ